MSEREGRKATRGRASTARRITGVFITGTDTGVGKTLVSVSIVRALVARGLAVAAMKPVAAGAVRTPQGPRSADALALAAVANVTASYDRINPYCLRAPISPHIAAAEEDVAIDVAVIRQRFEELAQRADCIIVEGAGGWLAPISASETLADVARALSLPVVLVVGLRLGCLNHALLSAQAIAADGLELGGWIGNAIDPDFERSAENISTLERRLGLAPLALVPHLARAAKDCLAGNGSEDDSGDGSRDGLRLEPGVALHAEAGDALAALCAPRIRDGRRQAEC